MHYRLRTLMVLLAVLPPLLAGGWWGYGKLTPQPDPNYFQPYDKWGNPRLDLWDGKQTGAHEATLPHSGGGATQAEIPVIDPP